MTDNRKTYGTNNFNGMDNRHKMLVCKIIQSIRSSLRKNNAPDVMLNEINCGDVLVTCEVLYSVKMLEIPGMIFTKEIFLPKKKVQSRKVQLYTVRFCPK